MSISRINQLVYNFYLNHREIKIFTFNFKNTFISKALQCYNLVQAIVYNRLHNPNSFPSAYTHTVPYGDIEVNLTRVHNLPLFLSRVHNLTLFSSFHAYISVSLCYQKSRQIELKMTLLQKGPQIIKTNPLLLQIAIRLRAAGSRTIDREIERHLA